MEKILKVQITENTIIFQLQKQTKKDKYNKIYQKLWATQRIVYVLVSKFAKVPFPYNDMGVFQPQQKGVHCTT